MEKLEAFAAGHGRTLLDLAVGGLASIPGVASVIAGATKPEQAAANALPEPGSCHPTELDALSLLPA